MSDTHPEKPCEHETAEDGLKYALPVPHAYPEGGYSADVQDAVCELYNLARMLHSSITGREKVYLDQTFWQLRSAQKTVRRLDTALTKQILEILHGDQVGLQWKENG